MVPPISIRSTSSKDIQGMGQKGASARANVVAGQPIKVNHEAQMQRPQTSNQTAASIN